MASRSFTPARRRLTALRLSALGIDSPAGPAADIPGRLLALQAQDYRGALWSVGLRAPGSTEAEVERAHADGAFVRSWPMRGTLHFLRGADLRWMLPLTAERVHRSAAARHRELELGDEQFQLAERVARSLLADGAVRDRAELLAAFEDAGLATTGQRGPHLLGALARWAVILLVSQTGYALVDDVVAAASPRDRADALRELALRYFRSHGPATVADLAWWAGLTVTDARSAAAAARPELEELTLDGVGYLHAPGLAEADPGVHVLPGFDEYLLGYADRSAPLAGAGVELVAPGKNGMFLATVVADGEVVGFWKRTLRARRVDIRVSAVSSIPARRRPAIARSLERYGEYLGLEVVLEFED